MADEAAGVAVLAEAECLALARRGDAAARERLYVSTVRVLLRHARVLLRDPAEAEDLVQDAFAAAFGSLGRFRGDASFLAYLRGIMLNLARRRWRTATRTRTAMATHRLIALAAADRDARMVERIDADREVHALWTAVEGLRPKLREAFVLLCVERLSGPEAARLAGERIEVLRVRATRAKQIVLANLRGALGEETA